MADETGNAELAQRFYGAIERRDYAAVEACYTPDAQLWHNIDGKTQTVAENLAEIRAVAGRVASIRYDLQRRIDYADGFVQLYTVHFGLPDGGVVTIPVCAVNRVDNGRISGLQEYFDSVPFRPLLEG